MAGPSTPVQIPVSSLLAASVPNIGPIGSTAGSGPTPGGGQTSLNNRTNFDFNGGNSAAAIAGVRPNKQQDITDPASQFQADRGEVVYLGTGGDALTGGLGPRGLQTLLANGVARDAEEVVFVILSAFTLDPEAIATIWGQFGGQKKKVTFIAAAGATEPVALTASTAFGDGFAEELEFIGVALGIPAAVTAPAAPFAGPLYPLRVTAIRSTIINPNAGGNIWGGTYVGAGVCNLSDTTVTCDGDVLDTAGAGTVEWNINTATITSTSGAVNLNGGGMIDQLTATAGTTFDYTNSTTAAGAITNSTATGATGLTGSGNGASTKIENSTLTATAGAVTITGVNEIINNTISAAAGTASISGSNNQTLSGNTVTTAGGLTVSSGSAPGNLEQNGNTFLTPYIHAGGTLAPFAKVCASCNAYGGPATYNGDGASSLYFGVNEDFQSPGSAIGVVAGFEYLNALLSNSQTEANVTPVVVGAANFPANPTNL